MGGHVGSLLHWYAPTSGHTARKRRYASKADRQGAGVMQGPPMQGIDGTGIRLPERVAARLARLAHPLRQAEGIRLDYLDLAAWECPRRPCY